jgi:hypothetical protein
MGSSERKKPISDRHTARGQAAGYLFQPERALVWLSTAGKGAKVGIETDDDITIAVNGNATAREQDKHTVKGSNPFSDFSKELWKSILIWLDAAAQNEFDPTTCKLYLATNARVGDGFLKSVLGCDGKPTKIRRIVEDLLSKQCPDGTQTLIDRFKAHDATLRYKVLAAIELLEAVDCPVGGKLRKKLASNLHLPNDVDNDIIIDGLLGWIHSTSLENWRAQQPAWIAVSAFDNQMHRLIRQLRSFKRLGYPQHLVIVSQAERRKQINKLFVHQLKIIDASEEEILKAVDDFCRCKIEKIRLANEGDLTGDDWIDFDDQLTRHWSVLSEREKRSTPSHKPKDIGHAIYSAAMLHQATLAQQQAQPYLTCGTYHRLANEATLGWHPDFERLFKS